MVKDRFLNFEDFLHHPDLPQFSNKHQSYHIKYRFEDFHRQEEEIVEEVVKANNYDAYKSKSIF